MLQFCVEARLNLGMNSRLTGGAKNLVGHFKHSSLAMSSLKEKQQYHRTYTYSEYYNLLELHLFYVGATD